MSDDDQETARVRVVMKSFRRETFQGEILERGDEGEVLKAEMRGGCKRGVYERLDGCQAEVQDEGRGRLEYGDDDEKRTRPCTNDAVEGAEYCGVHQ